VVVGGLIVSAAVTVFLVPCLYYLMERRHDVASAPAPEDSL
jgi:Cu/Ag efflux pump CusA